MAVAADRLQSGPIRLPLVLRYAAPALLVPAGAILIHELGHFGAHALFGYELNRLTYDGVVAGAAPAGVDSVLADGISFGAGSALSLLLLGVGVLSIWRWGANPLGLGLILFECLRAAIGFSGAVAQSGWPAVAGRFGELRYVVTALDGPLAAAAAVAWLEIALPYAALVYALRRQPRGSRRFALAGTAAGIVGGLVLWLGLVGPLLLPR